MQQEDTKQSATTSVLAEVASILKNSAPTVKDRLVAALTERELVKRVDLLDKALVKLRDFKKEVDKIKPQDQFDLDGNKVATFLSKQQHEDLKKAKEKVQKLEKAFEKALAGEEFDKLSNLVAGSSTEE